LIITPKPNTLIGLDFYFKPLKNRIIPQPKINTPERKGFVAIEWGGMLASNN